LIDNLPASRVRSVAMGLAELSGKARMVGEPLISPVSRVKCIWVRTKVIRRTGSGNNEHDTVVLDRVTCAPFELEDDTGKILVLPDGAEVEGDEVCDVWVVPGVEAPPFVRSFCLLNGIGVGGWSGASLRVTESAMLTDVDVFVVGAVDRINDPATDRQRRVGEVLRGWLGAPDEKARIDANHDGQIDQEEWAAAKDRAQEQVLSQEGPVKGPQIAVRKPPSGLFLISSGSRRDALQAMGHPGWRLTAGIALLALAWMLFPFGRYQDYGAEMVFAVFSIGAQAAGIWHWIRMRA
jgi:hypothetical protein